MTAVIIPFPVRNTHLPCLSPAALAALRRPANRPSPTVPLPFSAFKDAHELQAAGLTPADLHVAARHGGLKNWPMINRGRIEPHTSLHYVREWIASRLEDGVCDWARCMAAAPQEVQDIERLIT